MDCQKEVKELRESTGMNRREFCDYFGIPYRTVTEWERGNRQMPEYVLRLMRYKIQISRLNINTEVERGRKKKNQLDRKILIQETADGKKEVVLPHVIFAGRKNMDWNKVEEYLLQYVSDVIRVADTDDFISIDRTFADEYTSSIYTRKLKGGLVKVKANMVQGVPEMIEIATDKRWNEDFKRKHGKRAEQGWYRYNSRFAMPVLDEDGDIVSYNHYVAVLIVRHAVDNKLYLYDIQNIKKETSNPLWT